jgi:dTDP-L-rhamnose 4-epimerase
MGKRILVTGGAGFIGSFIVDALLEAGHAVRVLDNLEPQVHGPSGEPPGYLNPEAEFVRADVRDREKVDQALEGVQVVFHEAAMVGVGQSMYDIVRYTSVNAVGAACLLEAILARRDGIEKMLVASSMSIYGEGRYRKPNGEYFSPRLRPEEQLRRHEWEMRTPEGEIATPVGTDETKPLFPTSIYAVNKRDHEEMFLATGIAYSIPTVALRYFNVYGPRQALSNPYTGVAAIFSGRLLNGHAPVIFEDGRQSRDFIHVSDVARANVLAMQRDEADYQIFNVGTGRPVTILGVAETLIEKLQPGTDIEPEITGKYRAGDIRHCFSDPSKIRHHLGFEAQVPFEEGFDELIEWVRRQQVADGFDRAHAELAQRGLVEED